jgi:hypothetical protein
MEKLVIAFLSLFTLNLMVPNNNNDNQRQLQNVDSQYDGPYVYYKGDKVYADYVMIINGEQQIKTDSVSIQQKDNLVLHVTTDNPSKSFQVKLKKELKIENSETPKVNKLLVLSDIEGNFLALRKLLVAGKVIDEDLNWTFGDGQLVLVGDFFDRGFHVTEVLWFIYYLEDKAKAAGGYVQFVLGNHEIMNLNNDLRYLNPKYVSNATLMQKSYISLYDENSELGRWLRTKNIVEKIGDLLFTHGGISPIINRLNLSIPDINKTARPYYGDTTYKYPDPKTDTIFGDSGPFWYRGYYQRASDSTALVIDTTLNQYKIDHIVTGHTIVGDTVSVWYNGRLFNTDLRHAVGKSEALMIENDKFYRVDQQGNKVLLMEGRRQKK